MAETSANDDQYAEQLADLKALEVEGQITNIRPVFIEGELAGYDYDPANTPKPPAPAPPPRDQPRSAADRFAHDRD